MKPDLVSVAPLPPPHMDALAQEFVVHALPSPEARAAFFAGPAGQARFVQTTGFTGMGKDLIDAMPRLEVISCFGVGVDAIDLSAARARGVVVANTPDVLNDCVADLALGMIIGAARELHLADRYVRSGQWVTAPMPLARKVSGKRLGILGFGRIGKAIAKRAQAFDMEIAYHGRHRQDDAPYAYFPSLTELARWSDFLVVICPGGAATRHLVNRAVMDALGPQGTLVNVARGSVVDERALVAALKEGTLGYAALDVFEDEPRVPAELLAMDNVLLLPHVGSATTDTRRAMAALTVDNLIRFKRERTVLTPV